MSIVIVKSVEHFNEKLFRFTTTKPEGFKFVPGQFTMIGLPDRGDDVHRAYSICSSPNEPFLEFFSIKVPDGEFTQDLVRIIPGDEVEVSTRPVGTLVLDNLLPGKTLWMLATGTGIAPFISIVRDGSAFKQFERVVLVHSTRMWDEQAYQDEMRDRSPVWYVGTATRDFELLNNKRITTMIYDGSLFREAVYPPIPEWTPEHDRVMLCGNEDFVKEMREYFDSRDWKLGTRREPGHYLIEKAFVS